MMMTALVLHLPQRVAPAGKLPSGASAGAAVSAAAAGALALLSGVAYGFFVRDS
jgi:hypothetical protein